MFFGEWNPSFISSTPLLFKTFARFIQKTDSGKPDSGTKGEEKRAEKTEMEIRYDFFVEKKVSHSRNNT